LHRADPGENRTLDALAFGMVVHGGYGKRHGAVLRAEIAASSNGGRKPGDSPL